MIATIDVYYYDHHAHVACVVFENWEQETITQEITVNIDEVADYEPGQFYKRELPCILKVLKNVNLEEISCIILDSYVVLDDDGKLGLGGYLYHHLKEKIPIIGVAKKQFLSNQHNAIGITRGESKNPLYVSALGMDLTEAAQKIQNMKGQYRIPTVLKLVDQLSRK